MSVGSPASPERTVTPAAVPCCAQAEFTVGPERRATLPAVWCGVHAANGCESSAAATQQPCSLLLVFVGVLQHGRGDGCMWTCQPTGGTASAGLLLLLLSPQLLQPCTLQAVQLLQLASSPHLDSALVQPWRRLGDHTRLPQQPRHRRRRLCAHRQPVPAQRPAAGAVRFSKQLCQEPAAVGSSSACSTSEAS